MTVTELWERLAAMPPDAEVWIDDSERHISRPVKDTFALAGHDQVFLLIGE